jgi:DNA repair protein RadD
MNQTTLNWAHHASPSRAPTCRDYQLRAVSEVDRELQTNRSVLILSPTGSGKTVIAAEHIRSHSDATYLFMAPRRELINQTCRKLDDVGVQYGVILAGDKRMNLYSRVQVASVDTLLSRVVRQQRLKLPSFDFLFIDEAHIGITLKREALFNLWPAAKIIGMTATPCNSAGKALGRIYSSMVEVSSTRELTERGFLVPARYFSVSEPDLSRVRTTAGDFNIHDLAEATNTPKLVGGVVEHWLEHAGARRTVVFCVDIAHSVATRDQFVAAGVKAEHVDANTPQDERNEIFSQFSDGRVQVLCNCTLASIGFDLPELDCVVLNRATKSLGLYIQMLGRGLRTADGKKDCLVLDHAGNVHRHGFAEDERFWSLHGKYALDEARTLEARQKKITEGKDPKQITCPQCKCVWSGSNQCPSCHYTFPVKPRDQPRIQGTLIELMGHDKARPTGVKAWSIAQRIDFLSQLMSISAQRDYKAGWVKNKYKDKTGSWPPESYLRAIRANGNYASPTIETIRWVQASMMSWKRTQPKRPRMIDPPPATDDFYNGPDIEPIDYPEGY